MKEITLYDDSVCEKDDDSYCVLEQRIAIAKDTLGQSRNGIILFGKLGLWNGTVDAYNDVEDYYQCYFCSSDALRMRYYVDENGDFRLDYSHHDGTNRLRARAWKANVSDRQKEVFREKILKGDYTEEDVQKYTKKIGRLFI